MNDKTPADEFLEHFGVKGMKWGKRKDKTSGKGDSDGDSDEITRIRRKSDSKNRRRLSDSSLKKKISRLENEKRLKELVEADIAPGRAMAKRILKSSGEKALKTFTEGALKYAAKSAMKKKFDIGEAADFIFPGGGGKKKKE